MFEEEDDHADRARDRQIEEKLFVEELGLRRLDVVITDGDDLCSLDTRHHVE